jgi:hypothetical protein
MLVAGWDRGSAAAVLQRMQEACPEALFCAGLAQAAAGDTPDSVLNVADEALYEAKRASPGTRARTGQLPLAAFRGVGPASLPRPVA